MSKASPIVIAFAGKKHAGKSECSKILAKHYPNLLTKFSFAARLKRGTNEFFDFSDDQLYGDQKEVIDPRYNTSCREILQWLGTDVIRKRWPELWVNHFRKFRKNSEFPMIFIDDLRFRNETEAIIEQPNHVIIIVENPEEKEGKAPEHESEDVSQVIDAAKKGKATLFFLKNDKTKGLDVLEQKLMGILVECGLMTK